jgi:hypothetical protein
VQELHLHLELQEPQKFIRIGIFGPKTKHLATLVGGRLHRTGHGQGDQMSLRKNRPKCLPSTFSCQNKNIALTGKKQL